MKKILIIKSSSMGDIIHALPVAHDIRQALPDARIDWVAEESFADIPPLAPAVEKVYVTAFRRWRKSPFSVKTRREVSALKAELQAEHYDIVIDIQGLIRSGLVPVGRKRRQWATRGRRFVNPWQPFFISNISISPRHWAP